MTLVEQLQNPAGEFGLLSQEQQRAKLLELHPACRELDDLGAAEDNCPGLPALSGEDVLLTIGRLSINCTSGWSGWSNRLIKRIVVGSAFHNDRSRLLLWMVDGRRTRAAGCRFICSGESCSDSQRRGRVTPARYWGGVVLIGCTNGSEGCCFYCHTSTSPTADGIWLSLWCGDLCALTAAIT
mmetsp:Transcript_83502/g.163575  ORF Transcript_83502/g.163575 Transcript_83502/m.163575 type:complete len:183 (+) Transcript_83502:967-1515(+)